MNESMTTPWLVSLHGGHSGEFCDHAQGMLREVLDAAVAAGCPAYGVSEHAPRLGDHYLYETEVHMGWTVESITKNFERYAQTIHALADEYADRLEILRGFEIEVVPPDRYVEIMQGYREQLKFDYIVGSVHFVHDMNVDGPVEKYKNAMNTAGGAERLAIQYYEAVAEMVIAMKPEIVAHIDLIRLNGHLHGGYDTPSIRDAAQGALEAVKNNNGILEVNTAGWRKGLEYPYPEPWIIDRAKQLEIPFCFGDDSHGPDLVAHGIPRARDYLLEHGVDSITILSRDNDAVKRKIVSLSLLS
jgi:histidinol-phosphatase (PHP family)